MSCLKQSTISSTWVLTGLNPLYHFSFRLKTPCSCSSMRPSVSAHVSNPSCQMNTCVMNNLIFSYLRILKKDTFFVLSNVILLAALLSSKYLISNIKLHHKLCLTYDIIKRIAAQIINFYCKICNSKVLHLYRKQYGIHHSVWGTRITKLRATVVTGEI